MVLGKMIAVDAAAIVGFDQVEATGSNYFVSWLAFGDMTHAESLRSLELFAREVMPAFASARAQAAQ